jgi:hypothetical protein
MDEFSKSFKLFHIFTHFSRYGFRLTSVYPNLGSHIPLFWNDIRNILRIYLLWMIFLSSNLPSTHFFLQSAYRNNLLSAVTKTFRSFISKTSLLFFSQCPPCAALYAQSRFRSELLIFPNNSYN